MTGVRSASSRPGTPAWWLATLFSFVPLVPAVRAIERMHAERPALEGDNREYSVANILTLVFGGLFFLLAVIGTLVPAEAVA